MDIKSLAINIVVVIAAIYGVIIVAPKFPKIIIDSKSWKMPRFILTFIVLCILVAVAVTYLSYIFIAGGVIHG